MRYTALADSVRLFMFVPEANFEKFVLFKSKVFRPMCVLCVFNYFIRVYSDGPPTGSRFSTTPTPTPDPPLRFTRTQALPSKITASQQVKCTSILKWDNRSQQNNVYSIYYKVQPRVPVVQYRRLGVFFYTFINPYLYCYFFFLLVHMYR